MKRLTAICRTQVRRDGVSLLEVLISIGVLAVGLLGVISLIPAAASMAENGARSDSMAIAGRRVLREFQIRGFNDPRNWEVPLSGGLPRSDGIFDIASTFVLDNPRRAFCLDPVGYALWQKQNPTPTLTANAPDGLYSFPSQPIDATSKFMPRLRIRSFPNDFIGPVGGAVPPLIDETFYFQDDLEFELPASSSQDPLQIPFRHGSGGNFAQKRFAKGDLSWLATFVPERVVPTSGVLPEGMRYKLSIAVVRGRNSLLSSSSQVVSRNLFDGSGTITLASPLDIKPGRWLLLMNGHSGQVDTNGVEIAAGGGGAPHQYEWYQVVANDGAILTVNGPDWLADPTQAFYETFAVAIPEVVAVYSKSIRLVE